MCFSTFSSVKTGCTQLSICTSQQNDKCFLGFKCVLMQKSGKTQLVLLEVNIRRWEKLDYQYRKTCLFLCINKDSCGYSGLVTCVELMWYQPIHFLCLCVPKLPPHLRICTQAATGPRQSVLQKVKVSISWAAFQFPATDTHSRPWKNRKIKQQKLRSNTRKNMYYLWF